MAVTFGFYNSLNGDRKYDALQISSIFDGVIRDGIFMHVTGQMLVTADGSSMVVKVAPGRAWFNHTWTLNDAILPVTIPLSEIVLDRIDAVVIDINAETRINDILVVSGTPSSNPVKPVLSKSSNHWQYPLAYIYVKAQTTTIRQADVENKVGTSECPWVTAPLETVNVDFLFDSWRDQWEKFYDEQTLNMLETASSWREQWRTWFDNYTTRGSESFGEFIDKSRDDFYTWFESIRGILDGDVAGNVADTLVDHENRIKKLEKFKHDIEVNNVIFSPITASVTSSGSSVNLEELETADKKVLEIIRPICFC